MTTLEELRQKWVKAKEAGDTQLMERIAREGKELKERENVCPKCQKRIRVNLYLCDICERSSKFQFNIKETPQEKLL